MIPVKAQNDIPVQDERTNMRVVTDRTRISTLVAEFRDRVSRALNRQGFYPIGHKGWSDREMFQWSDKLDMWMVCRDHQGQRYWTAFGLGSPKESGNSIVAEINFPKEGIDRRIAGVFVENGPITYVAHRGKIGGGRKGIGKGLFWESFQGTTTVADDGNMKSKLAIIADIASPRFVCEVKSFIDLVHSIKD
ncbi:MAG: hypothetical protein HY673_03420 [Chloroflexi bacterium]|nr:hypothetical protein [Chloroflexota bacterium]